MEEEKSKKCNQHQGRQFLSEPLLFLILIFTPDIYIGSKYRLSVYLVCNNRYRPWKTHIGRPLVEICKNRNGQTTKPWGTPKIMVKTSKHSSNNSLSCTWSTNLWGNHSPLRGHLCPWGRCDFEANEVQRGHRGLKGHRAAMIHQTKRAM